MHTQPNYDVEVSNVREVVLLGSADLSFWRDHLRPAGLYPVSDNGKAQIVMAATEARFMGLRFREMPISIPVSLTDGGKQAGFYLIHATNSIKFFACVERARFGTPYYHGKIEMSPELPASFRLTGADDALLAVTMDPSATSRPVVESWLGQDWEWPVFLPVANTGTDDAGNVFYARVRGQAGCYRFESEDAVTIKPSRQHPVLQWLIDSQYTPTHWCLREGATHGKSKTVRRGAAQLG